MPPISLPYADDAEFDSDDLVDYFRSRGMEPLRIGAERVVYDNLTHIHSLERWLRDLPIVDERYRNTMQAVASVVRALCATERFYMEEIPNGRPGVDPMYLRCRQVFSEDEYVEKSASNIVTFLTENPFNDDLFDWTWTVSDEVAEILHEYQIDAGKMGGIDNAIRVKRSIRNKINQNISAEERNCLLRWYVIEYGGVRANSNLDDSIFDVEELAHRGVVNEIASNVTLDGVSTETKCLTLFNENLPIYDSRVCFALNVINYVYGYRDWFAKSPEGRNASIGLFDIREKFLLANRIRLQEVIEELSGGHKQRAARAVEPILVPPERVYYLWCQIVGRVSEILRETKNIERASIDEIEIMLFTMAPTVCVVKLANELLDQLPELECRFSNAA